MSLFWFTNPPDAGVKRHHSELEWRRHFVRELEFREVNVVLDVGANSGQYAKGLREAGYEGRIVSFEPLSMPFSILERSVALDPSWDCRQCALGDRDGMVSMNVAGNAGQSSSILPMLKTHRDVLPAANYVGTEEVTVRRLDSLTPGLLAPKDVAFLKLDVQGFEKQVIAGGAATVNDRCGGMQLELSFEPLYDGGMLADEALDLVRSLGFTLTGFAPFFFDVRTGRLLQADGVFFRGPASDARPPRITRAPTTIEKD
ncbi:FkbM family methyltransferase [Mycobacterium nebraskense]|uniref:FkbM family methyltransferase n=1 Tax=Mycobacterium nebraskense TaxID=244292 RepID=UPI000641A1D3|nr:FkbM family methyltransferase [Mycobacterium nebraskense]KLO34917.1 FkbM family methyltransferase [Mycobacterium nebraskense]